MQERISYVLRCKGNAFFKTHKEFWKKYRIFIFKTLIAGLFLVQDYGFSNKIYKLAESLTVTYQWT